MRGSSQSFTGPPPPDHDAARRRMPLWRSAADSTGSLYQSLIACLLGNSTTTTRQLVVASRLRAFHVMYGFGEITSAAPFNEWHCLLEVERRKPPRRRFRAGRCKTPSFMALRIKGVLAEHPALHMCSWPICDVLWRVPSASDWNH